MQDTAISDSTVPGQSASIAGTGMAATVGWCRSAERAAVTNSSGNSCVFCGGTQPDAVCLRAPGRPRNSWILQIGNGSPLSIRREWKKAQDHGHHGESSQRTSAVFTSWWWWWPAVWNALPRDVRLSGSASAHTFNKKLKTALFSTAYL